MFLGKQHVRSWHSCYRSGSNDAQGDLVWLQGCARQLPCYDGQPAWAHAYPQDVFPLHRYRDSGLILGSSMFRVLTSGIPLQRP